MLDKLVLNPAMSKSAEDSRVATYKQPRGRKIPPLVSEFGETKIIRCRDSEVPALDDKNRLTADFYGVPAGMEANFCGKHQWIRGIQLCTRQCGSLVSLGILLLFSSLLKMYNTLLTVPPEILKVVCNILSKHPLQVMKKRLEKLQCWRLCAKELSEDNKKRFSNMDAGCAAVLKGKHLSLLQKIAEDLSWPDGDVHKEIQEGFKLVGMQNLLESLGLTLNHVVFLRMSLSNTVDI